MNNTISDIKVKEEFKHNKKLSDFFNELKKQFKNKNVPPKVLEYIFLSLLHKKSDLYIKIKGISQIQKLLISFDKENNWKEYFETDSYSLLEVINSFYELSNKLFEFNKTKLVQEKTTKLKYIFNSIKRM